MSTAFLVVAILSVLVGVAAAVGMARELWKHGVKVNPLLARLYFFHYLAEYRRITLAETGRVGPLRGTYVAAMIVALVCAVIGLALRAM